MSPIVNLQLVVKCKKRSFHSFKVEVALLRYIVFYCELGCDTSEPHVSYISRACSSLVRQPYYIPNRFLLKISGLETILATKKGRWDGRSFYMDEYTLIFLFSRCIRCAQKRDCWESVRFASERSRVRIPLGPPICRIVLYDAAFFMQKNFGRPCRAPNPEVGCEPGGGIHVLFENPSVSRFFLCILQSSAGKCIAFMPPSRKFLQKFPRHRMLTQP